jgi:hypothetical protein
MKSEIKMSLVVLAVVAFFLAPTVAPAAPLGFYNITANDPGDAAIGEAQLWVDVTDPGGGQVAFTFNNDGPDPCSVAGVFFDDGTLLGVASIIEGPGVSFSLGSSPPNLPGANMIDPPFAATAGFSADSDPPVQPDGVNPGEYLTLVFDLQSGSTFSDVVDDLSSGALRIGIHVQGYASAGSESFVNNPPDCPDEDGDGYGDEASIWCDPPLDCDDSDPNVNPGAEEVCNGIDDDCDGIVDNVDADFDGYTDEACGGDDCNDGNPDINPGAVEGCCDIPTCFDNIDNDCDGLVDQEQETCREWCGGGGWMIPMEASTVGTSAGSRSKGFNYLAALLLPLAAVLLWRGKRRRG